MEEDSDRCPACDQPLEEEYIDMDLTSTTFFCYPINTSPESREFEFRMSSNPADEREPTPSPADELFYKGNLLPLHLPPRLQMLQKLLQNPITTTTSNEKATDPLEANITTAAHNTGTIAPSKSFKISPASAACCISSCSTVLYQPKQLMQSPQRLKLKASREYLKFLSTRYLKSLFTSSICSEGTYTVRKAEKISSRAEEGRRNPSGQVRKERDEVSVMTTGKTGEGKGTGDADCARGFSFLGLMKHRLADCSSSPSSTSSCSRSSSSCSSSGENSNGSCESLVLKRSSSVSSEGESFIQNAIAYCKKSLQSDCTRIGLGK